MSEDLPPGLDGGCSSGESFALRVIGQDMAPEFNDGDIIIVEPDGALRDGSFVLAMHAQEWLLRCLRKHQEGWRLEALNPACAHHRDVPLAELGDVRGVIIQKAVPGRRRASKFYV